MAISLFANNIQTTLTSNITSIQTAINLVSTAGLPNPSAGQYFVMTFTNGTTNEIVWVTNVAGNIITCTRGREGTGAASFTAGTYASCFPTAGSMSNLVQMDQLQNQLYSYADVGGTANALTATIPSNLTAIPDGCTLILGALLKNTGAATLNVTLGSTVTGVYPIIKGAQGVLAIGDIPSLGYPILVTWSPEDAAWAMQNPATGIAVSSVPTGSIAQFPCLTAPSGYIVANGQLLSRTTYAALYAFALASGNIVTDAAWSAGQYGSFSTGDLFTTFRIPQYGGYFLRTEDNGNGIDPSRVLGSLQQNQNQTHTHAATSVVTDPGHTHTTNATRDSGTGGSGYYYLQSAAVVATIYPSVTGVTVATSITSAGGVESRPVNISVLTCIKT